MVVGGGGKVGGGGGGVGWGIWGMKKDSYYLNIKEKNKRKVLFLIPPAILHWFDGNHFLHFLQEEWRFR